MRELAGSIVQDIEARSLLDAMTQAEWFVEAMLKFRLPARGERKAG